MVGKTEDVKEKKKKFKIPLAKKNNLCYNAPCTWGYSL